MRHLTLSVVIAFAVFFTAFGASAQGRWQAEWPTQWQGHCLTVAPTAVSAALESRVLVVEGKVASKGTPALGAHVSRIERERVQAARPLSGRSQAPTLCLDPHQAGCHAEMPDTPEHHGSILASCDAASATSFFQGVPPPQSVALCTGGEYLGGPREGFASASWRPPSA